MKIFTKKTEHFEFFYFIERDYAIIEEISDRIELIYLDLSYKFQCFINTVTIRIYPTLDKFHNAVGLNGAPNWVIGCSKDNSIDSLSPLEHHPIYNYADLIKVIIHELVHIFTKKICCENTPSILLEGIATYESKQDYLQVAFDIMKANMQQKPFSFKNFYSMNIKNECIYPYSYSFTKFIIENYKYDNFLSFLKNRDYFLTRGEDFYNKWVNTF